MTELIKQRLLGMFIVVIAGVVFLPDLLDGQKQMTKEEFKKIPQKPETNEQPLVSDFPLEEIENALAQAPEQEEIIATDADNSTAPDEQEPNLTTQVGTLTAAEDVTEVSTDVKGATQQTEAPVKRVETKFEKETWILQLGSFKHKENVDTLRAQIKDAGYQTFIKPVETKAGVLQKVYIGPELKRDKLEKAQAELKKITGLDGKITQYNPIN